MTERMDIASPARAGDSRRFMYRLLVIALVSTSDCAPQLPSVVRYAESTAPVPIGQALVVTWKVDATFTELKLELQLTNRASGPAVLMTKGLLVRLPDGRTIEPSGEEDDETKVSIGPGETRAVRVEFTVAGKDMRTLTHGWLIVGGVIEPGVPAAHTISVLPLLHDAPVTGLRARIHRAVPSGDEPPKR